MTLPVEPTLQSPEVASPRLESLDHELLTFLREESAASRVALRQDSEANRQVFLGTLKIIAYPLAILIAITGFLGWRSVADLEKNIQTEAQRKTDAEVARMQGEIRQRLSSQFETPQLQKMVREAALGQTQTVLRPLIVEEVGTDVARGVKEEQHTINSTLVTETQKAVDKLTPTIDNIVTSRVNLTVDKSVDSKITAQVKPILSALQKDQQVSNLMTRAQAGSGSAFDSMIQLASAPDTDAELRETIGQLVRKIITEHNSPMYSSLSFIKPVTEEQKLQLLHDLNPRTRQAALDSLSESTIRSHLDALFQIMTTDQDLAVREAGFRRFNSIRMDNAPEHQIQNLDNFTAAQWWYAHRTELMDKAH